MCSGFGNFRYLSLQELLDFLVFLDLMDKKESLEILVHLDLQVTSFMIQPDPSISSSWFIVKFMSVWLEDVFDRSSWTTRN